MRRNAPFEPRALGRDDFPTPSEQPPEVAPAPERGAPSSAPLVLAQNWRVQPGPEIEPVAEPNPDSDSAAAEYSGGDPEQTCLSPSDKAETRAQEDQGVSGAVSQPQDIFSARDMGQFETETAAPTPQVRSDRAALRFRRRVLTGARLLVFVVLPGALAGWYFFVMASPLYMAETRFVIQTPFAAAASQQGQTVQETAAREASLAAALHEFLRARPALRQLDSEEGFKAHFQQEHVDPVRRLLPDADDDAAFQTYRRHVLIDHDPAFGMVTVRVWALSADDSLRFAEALVRLARTQLDTMGAHLREDALRSARDHLEEIQRDLVFARQQQAELEHALAPDRDAGAMRSAPFAGQLDARLRPGRVRLQAMRGDLAAPHPLEAWEDAMGAQIDAVPVQRANGPAAPLPDSAELQRQLVAAQTEVETHELMRAQALEQIEQIQGEIARQTAALIVAVAPVAADRPDYPRAAEYTAVAVLGFLGLFLLVSLTGAALRKRASV